METAREEKTIYQGFRISIILKGIISLIEVVSGLSVLLIPTSLIVGVIGWFAAVAPTYGVPDIFVDHIETLALVYTRGTTLFVSLYLLTRGLIKTGLIWALLKNKLWAYPASLVVLGLFIVYQAYQIITTHSFIVIGITLFDLIVVYFIWREYGIVREHLASQVLLAQEIEGA